MNKSELVDAVVDKTQLSKAAASRAVYAAFNDADGRTQAEMIALFDEAIAAREAQLQAGGRKS